MVDTALNIADPDRAAERITYEQPLSERMRTFLRIEFLRAQAAYHAKDLRGFGARAAVASLLEMMMIIGRGDVRADVLKELERQAAWLTNYSRQPGVDQDRLGSLVNDVGRRKATISQAGPNFMNSLKECEFLNTIKHRSSIPGGTCVFDIPDYGYWLNLDHAERVEQFGRWIQVLEPICEAVAELLWLKREATEPVERVAVSGLYQHQTERQSQISLARVTIPNGANLYPEISAGRHRVTVRFVRWNGVDVRPIQAADDVRFLLALS
jgi:cell division protein ZapD